MARSEQERLKAIAKAAVAWFTEHHRDLPWRKTRDAYRIWISECMLQQTQVATVIPYYERFLNRFPDVQRLASAQLDEVYQLWAGLGYYRRARQLHAAAIEIVESGQAPFPIHRDAIAELPGIGRYTASAIASFAFDQPCGIVEANTQRLYARLIRCKEPLSDSSTQRTLWEFAEAIVSAWPHPTGELNQSLMELGSQVCKPRDPACGDCPLREHCKAYRFGEIEQIPAAKPKKLITELREIGLLISDSQGRWLLRRRHSGERWAGLWDFPRYDCTEMESESAALEFVAGEFHKLYGKRPEVGGQCMSVRHSVTRYRIVLRCFEARLEGRLKGRRKQSDSKLDSNSESDSGSYTEPEEFDWYTTEDLGNLALSSSGRKVADWLENRGS